MTRNQNQNNKRFTMAIAIGTKIKFRRRRNPDIFTKLRTPKNEAKSETNKQKIRRLWSPSQKANPEDRRNPNNDKPMDTYKRHKIGNKNTTDLRCLCPPTHKANLYCKTVDIQTLKNLLTPKNNKKSEQQKQQIYDGYGN